MFCFACLLKFGECTVQQNETKLMSLTGTYIHLNIAQLLGNFQFTMYLCYFL